jgi:uncharacterized membrane protein YjjP (DUF1212 family)
MKQLGAGTSKSALSLAARTAALLFSNGQTTERSCEVTARLAAACGIQPTILMHWGELLIFAEGDDGPRYVVLPVAPTNVDMGKVAATVHLVDEITSGSVAPDTVESALTAIEQRRPSSSIRFTVFAALGAAALGVVFGVTEPKTLILIALVAGAGGALRRCLSRLSHNPYVQPLTAAMLAGILGALAIRLRLGPSDAMVAICPCMVLVPGPHFLNGALDLARARIALGVARVAFASLVALVICLGLLIGLALGGAELPVTGAFQRVPIGYDVAAAGVAVAAYGTFFSMPWRMLPIPISIGILAHAARWLIVFKAGASVEAGAFVACMIAGTIVTPIATRLHLPFAALAFTSVVSLIPGIFLFRMSSGFLGLIAQGDQASALLLQNTAVNGATALSIMLAMAFGLIVPKMVIDRMWGAGAPA